MACLDIELAQVCEIGTRWAVGTGAPFIHNLSGPLAGGKDLPCLDRAA